MENTKEIPVEKIMKVTFKNKEEYDKFVLGETHSDKGVRTREGKSASQPDIAFLDGEEAGMRGNYPSSRREYYVGVSWKESLKQAAVDGIKDAIVSSVEDLLYDKEKRRLFIARVNFLWHEAILPNMEKAKNSVIKKAGFTIDVIHAIKSGEKTKAERLLETDEVEVKTTEVAESNPDVFTDDSVTIELTEEESRKIRILLALLVDILNRNSKCNINREGLTKEEYRLEKERINQIAIHEVERNMQLLMEKEDFYLDKKTVSILSEYLVGNIKMEQELIPVNR